MTAAIGSLCSGYGGLDQGLSLALGGDTRTAWHVEYDKHPSAILAHRYPDVPNHGDVKHTDWSQVEPVDWLTAGYPCQPFSLAGLRKGADDPRHLWPGVATAIGVLRPRGVLLENVAAHLALGLDTVLGDLARLGYDATWGVVRASDAGAPHERARLFVLATVSDADRPRFRGLPGRTVTEHTRGARRPGDAARWGHYAQSVAQWEVVIGRPAPRPDDAARVVEWLMGLPGGWVTDVPGLPRNAQLKALGNGVVPQQAALACRLLGVTAGAVAA